MACPWPGAGSITGAMSEMGRGGAGAAVGSVPGAAGEEGAIGRSYQAEGPVGGSAGACPFSIDSTAPSSVGASGGRSS